MAGKASDSVSLPAVVDLDALDEVRDRLLGLADRGSVEVEAAAVERLTTNALVMLLSAAETARRSSSTFKILHPSEAMQTAIGRLGLTAQFSTLIEG
ncbi:MAG TPA: STAS domain-containing protein [Devosiaceae bacterium]